MSVTLITTSSQLFSLLLHPPFASVFRCLLCSDVRSCKSKLVFLRVPLGGSGAWSGWARWARDPYWENWVNTSSPPPSWLLPPGVEAFRAFSPLVLFPKKVSPVRVGESTCWSFPSPKSAPVRLRKSPRSGRGEGGALLAALFAGEFLVDAMGAPPWWLGPPPSR